MGVVEGGPDQRSFQILRKDGEVETITDPKSQAFGYRGLEILDAMDRLKLGETVVETKVEYVLRD